VCRADEALLVREVRECGYAIDSVWDLVNNTPHPFLPRPFTGPYSSAYPVLIRHLSLKHHPRVRDGIIRALTVRDGGPKVEAALLEAFITEPAGPSKWVLANALRVAMPYSRRRRHPEIKTTLQSGGERSGR
jgi:hypothetical protein